LNAEARPERWSGLIISLHWAAGAVILALLALGWIMIYGGLDSAATFDLYQWHKSLGFAALALTAPRLAARLVSSSPPAPASPRWERRIAAVTQGSLYILAICVILSGWLVVSTSPLPVPTRFFDLFVIPNIARPDPRLFADAALAHRLAAWGMAFLIALHVAGALKHHFVDGDDVLKRMLPRWRRLSPPRA
jgi:cytochrome b561